MSKERIVVMVISWVVVIITLVMISNFSLQDSETSSNTSDKIVDSIVEVLPNGDKINHTQKDGIRISVRKLAHFGIYMLLGFTLINAMRNSFKLNVAFLISMSLLASFLYSLFDEFFIQVHSKGRAPQWTDVLIDTSGAIVGIFIFIVIILVYTVILNKIKAKKEIQS